MAEWFYTFGGKESGPVSGAELKRLADQGAISDNSQVKKGKDSPWVFAGQIKGLFSPTPPPLPTTSSTIILRPQLSKKQLIIAATCVALCVAIAFTSIVFLTPKRRGAKQSEPQLSIDASESASKYNHVPESARKAVAGLRRLDIIVGMGVKYDDYCHAMQDVCPDVQIFLESEESRQFPELSTFMSNALDCHYRTKRLWSKEFDSLLTPEEHLAVSLVMINAPEHFWKMAALNVAAARCLLDGDSAAKSDVLQRLALHPERYLATTAWEAARKVGSKEARSLPDTVSVFRSKS